jgi:hypothetical protein
MGKPLVIVFIVTHSKHCSHPVRMYAKNKSRTTGIGVQKIYEILFLVPFTNRVKEIMPKDYQKPEIILKVWKLLTLLSLDAHDLQRVKHSSETQSLTLTNGECK